MWALRYRRWDVGGFWINAEFWTRTDFGRGRNLAREQIPVFGAVLLLFPVFDVPPDFGRFESRAANR
jgi:hypothetical protein